jgi:hypothetical protein
MHVSFGAADSLVRFLDMYEDWLRENPDQPLLIRDWVRKHYFVERDGHDSQALVRWCALPPVSRNQASAEVRGLSWLISLPSDARARAACGR